MIKRLAVILSLLFLLAACGVSTITPFDGDLSATLRYTRADKEYTVIYSREGETERAEVTAPATLRGLVAEKSGENVTLSYTDLSFASAADEIFTPFELLAPAVFTYEDENLYKSENITLFTDENGTPVRVRGEVGSGEYEIEILDLERKNAE